MKTLFNLVFCQWGSARLEGLQIVDFSCFITFFSVKIQFTNLVFCVCYFLNIFWYSMEFSNLWGILKVPVPYHHTTTKMLHRLYAILKLESCVSLLLMALWPWGLLNTKYCTGTYSFQGKFIWLTCPGLCYIGGDFYLLLFHTLIWLYTEIV